MKKVYLIDIETLPNIAASFGIWKQNLQPNAILHTTSMICASWKELGKPKIHSLSIADYPEFKDNVYNDSKLVKDLYNAWIDADVLIAHNGDRFDIPYFQGRLLANGMTSFPKVQTIDTYKVAKSRLRLNYNRLDYLATVLGLPGKEKVDMTLWMRIVSGERKAVKEMVDYNKQDIRVLEAVYDKLISFIPSHANANLLTTSTMPTCPTCGSMNLARRGYHLTKVAKKQRYQCTDCGSWSHDSKSTQIVGVKSC